MRWRKLTRTPIATEMPVELQLSEELKPVPDIAATLFARALTAIRTVSDDVRLDHDICVRLCTAAQSHELNAAYRHKDGATNVLSFPADLDMPDEIGLLGDLAICWPVVVDEAAAQGKPVRDHLIHLFVHGVLHLLGYDHEEDAAAEEMETMEVRILEALQIPDPYAV